MNDLRADDLKCCGNCQHMDEVADRYENECVIVLSYKHPLGGFVLRSAPACDKWEIHTVIWERIYHNLPKNAEPITVSEEEYERLFGGNK